MPTEGNIVERYRLSALLPAARESTSGALSCVTHRRGVISRRVERVCSVEELEAEPPL